MPASPTPLRRNATLPCDPSSAGAARRLLRGLLTDAGRLDWLERAELACSEVVANAVLHAHTEVELAVEVSSARLHVSVKDFSPVVPVQRRYGEQATTGRGLALVAAVTSEHGIADAGPHGKTVWFTIAGADAEQSEEELLAAWGDADWDLTDLLDADEPAPPATEPVTAVRLLGLPPTLWLAARQHHDALLRELALHLAEHDEPGVDMAAADRARATVSFAVMAAAELQEKAGSPGGSLRPEQSSALAGVPQPVDLELLVTAELGSMFAHMQDTLDVAERLARDGQLLVRPGLPEIVAVRDWACEQVTAQLAGVAASAWPGTDHERFTVEVNDRRDEPDLGGWDIDQVRDAEVGVVAADEANRIIAVSRPLAAALGWAVDDLVGRRVVTLVPPHLREAHVAGFTRHLTTGESVVLDVPLTLPVLHADGSQIEASFRVQTAPIGRGRALYLAWIEPLPR